MPTSSASKSWGYDSGYESLGLNQVSNKKKKAIKGKNPMRAERALIPLEVSEQARQQLESIRHSRSQPYTTWSSEQRLSCWPRMGGPTKPLRTHLRSRLQRWVIGVGGLSYRGSKGIGFCDEVHPEGEPSPSHKDSDGTDLNGTIECLLNLRSVRDQFADAGARSFVRQAR